MPSKGWIDKKAATHFTLVHRSQDDPLINDEEAGSMVLAPTAFPNSKKTKTRQDLETEIAPDDLGGVRENEGEAAEHGVYYDDTKYDYMQHLRDIGNGEGVYLDAKGEDEAAKSNKGKGKMKLEDALAATSLNDDTSSIYSGYGSSSIVSYGFSQSKTYQNQQDVPDAIAGFQPDMDPRLREVLEALDDDAYVDDEDDVFGELAKDGEEVSFEEFEDSGASFGGWDDNEDDGWESDKTEKPEKEASTSSTAPEEGPNEDWMAEYSKFKKASSKPSKPLAPSELQSSVVTGNSSLASGRRKKRKGAKTSSTGYSMTSASLARTDGLTLLDARFDRIEEEYADADQDDQDDGVSLSESIASSNVSSRGGEVRADFDGMMDEFLGSYSMSGKRRVKKGGYQSGLEQLDEVRKGLGPARFRNTKATHA